MFEASAALTGLIKSGRFWKIETVAETPKPPSQTNGTKSMKLSKLARVLSPKRLPQPPLRLESLGFLDIDSRLPAKFERMPRIWSFGNTR